MELHLVIPDTGAHSEDLTICKKVATAQWAESIHVNVSVEKGDSYGAIFNRVLSTIHSGYVLFLYPWVLLKDNAINDIASFLLDGNADMLMFGYERISWNLTQVVDVESGELSLADFALLFHAHPGDVTYLSLWNKILSVEKIKSAGISFDEKQVVGYQQNFLLDYLCECQNIYCYNKAIATFYTQPEPDIPASIRIYDKSRFFEKYERLLKKAGVFNANAILDSERMDYVVYEKLRLKNAASDERIGASHQLDDIRSKITDGRFKTGLLIELKVLKGSVGNLKNYWFKERRDLARVKKEKKQKEKEIYLQENFFKYRKIFSVWHKTFGKKRILLYCESPTMKPHIFDYYACVRGMQDVDFYIYYPDNWDMECPEGVHLVQSYLRALWTPWDMIVCADAKVPLYYSKKETALIYINHGLHMISYDGGEHLYAYSMGRGLFTGMLEPNRRYADIISRETDEHVYHVGYKNAEKLIADRDKKAYYRKELGFKDDEIVVAVFGSWGADSLFHRVGNALIAQATDMMKEGYRFILSIHPKEYAKYDQAIEPLGDYVDSMAEKGFVVRNPKTPSIGYMLAADVVICDYSTLCEEAMLAGKPVVLSRFMPDRVWKHSVIAEYMKRGIVFDGTGDLHDLIALALNDKDLQSFAGGLVEDLLPPKEGYGHAVVAATEKILNGD